MEYFIDKNIFKINIKKNISTLEKNDIIYLCLLIYTIRNIEIKKGNEFDNPYLELKYFTNMLVTEHINIFNLCRKYTIYEILEYFKNFKENFSIQGNDTSLNINEYILEEENISQNIYIIFLCDIRNNKKEIEENIEKFNKILNIEDIYNII